MKIIQGPRGSGRTLRIINECAKSGGYIVCRPFQARIIDGRAKRMGLNIPPAISYDEFIKKSYGKGIKKFHIDDAEELLKRMCPGVEIETISICTKNIENLEDEVYGRLSIDEVIEHCDKKCSSAERCWGRNHLETCSMNNYYAKEYWEHRQVAEWLKELKKHIEN